MPARCDAGRFWRLERQIGAKSRFEDGLSAIGLNTVGLVRWSGLDSVPALDDSPSSYSFQALICALSVTPEDPWDEINSRASPVLIGKLYRSGLIDQR